MNQSATEQDRRSAHAISQHSRGVIRRECREADWDPAAVQKIVTRWARKYAVSESVIRYITTMTASGVKSP